ALADLAGTRDWLSARPHRAALAALLDGLAAGARLRTGVRRVEGRDRVERVVLGAVDAAGAPLPGTREWAVAADALVVGHGAAPATEITRLLRAEHVFARALGGWSPRLDETGQTSVPGLWVAGDAGGVLGPEAATLTGTRAGAAIARTLGHAAPATTKANRVLHRARALARLSAQHPAMTAAIPPDTLVCPDEGLSRAEIEAAIDDGAHDLNQLKHFTRCAMGPRQGRDCGDVVAELLALRLVALGRAPDIDTARRTAGQWTGRVPLRPLPLAAMIGAFDYTDIPVPEPAPL
ncbi:MAG: FAD/NAD(P)-binding oxidoreductase, partial [Pseudomonadota bacterium]